MKNSPSQMLHGAGIFTYIWVIFRANVGKHSIHGASGHDKWWVWMDFELVLMDLHESCMDLNGCYIDLNGF